MEKPAIGILHKNPEADLNQELLRRYRGKVEPKSYNYNLLEQYLDENFDYKERIVDGLELQFFKESYEANCPEGVGFSPISFLILENSKSERLYSAQCDSNEITLTIEKESAEPVSAGRRRRTPRLSAQTAPCRRTGSINADLTLV